RSRDRSVTLYWCNLRAKELVRPSPGGRFLDADDAGDFFRRGHAHEHLLDGAALQRPHPLAHSEGIHLLGAPAAQDLGPQRLRHAQHFMDGGAAAITGTAAVTAAPPPRKPDAVMLLRLEAQLAQE